MPEEIISPETRKSMIEWIANKSSQKKLATPENINTWIDYLCVNQLSAIAIELVANEKANRKVHFNESQKKEAARKKDEAAIKAMIEEVMNCFGPEEKEQYAEVLTHLSHLPQERNIFYTTPLGWAEIIKSINLDPVLLDNIIADYKSSEINNFLTSLLLTLIKQGKNEEAGQFALNQFFIQQIRKQGYFEVIQASLFVPVEKQPDFFQQNLDLLNEFFQKENMPPVSSPLTVKGLIDHITSALQSRDIKDCIKVLKLLPLYMNSQLRYDLTYKVTSNQIADFLSAFSETDQQILVYELKTKINDGYDLIGIVNVLSEDTRYDFINNFLRGISIDFLRADTEFATLVELVTNEEQRQTLLEDYDYLVLNGYALAIILKNLPEDRRIDYAAEHANLIKNPKQLAKVIKHLPKEYQFNFLANYTPYFRKAEELALNIQFVPYAERSNFIDEHNRLIIDGDSMATLIHAFELPEERFNFINRYREKLVNGYDIAAVIRWVPNDKQIDFIMQQISKIKNVNQLAAILSALKPETKLPLLQEIEKKMTIVYQDMKEVSALLKQLDANVRETYFIKNILPSDSFERIVKASIQKTEIDQLSKIMPDDKTRERIKASIVQKQFHIARKSHFLTIASEKRDPTPPSPSRGPQKNM